MTEWSQGSQKGFDAVHRNLTELTRFQLNIAAGYERSFLNYPELAEFSGRTAAALTEGALTRIGQSDSYPDHPAAAQIQDNYKRLVFTFTNPDDFEDRANDGAMLSFFDDVMSGSPVRYAELQVAVNRFSMVSVSVLACFLTLDGQGKFVNMAPAERFHFVQGFYKNLLAESGEIGD